MTALLLCLAMTATEPRPLVISTDIGCCFDDPWALAHLVAAKDRFEVRAIVTSHSPDIKQPVGPNAIRSAREALDRVPGRPKVDLVEGAVGPLSKQTGSKLGAGASRILEESRKHRPESRLTIVLIGPATDVAAALAADPTFADRVEVVALGFDGWPKGGDPYNVKHDVEAWRHLLESRIPITVVDLEVTTRDLGLTRDQLKSRFASLADGPLGLMDRNPALAKRLSGSADRAVIWDEGVTAFVLGFTEFEARPRPRLNPDGTFSHVGSASKVQWVTRIDSAKLWNDLEARMASGPGPKARP